ncbi:hypothetical protein [Desulfosporosinus shakirovi]|uniref:hypothetical protein n=1 Tax=Desulfosporosinus shakirovi TaxID=2885154 RepID=UPI001E3EE61D|nr:hypothetical protein [Desulfosporosinus sp. SRJS8]MCB8816456.1 hypothetical protein [Desulfosporosinus sp. SRJS8]
MENQKILEEHLLVWVPQFVAVLKEATSHSLYKGIAFILGQFLKTDLLMSDEILAAL